jgi:hypothetical protein
MLHAVGTIEFGDPEIAQWHLLPGLPGFAVRAHVGALEPATLTDRPANGLLAELMVQKDGYERTCLGNGAHVAMVAVEGEPGPPGDGDARLWHQAGRCR